MRVTNKGARAFFIWTLLAFVVMLCVIGWSMAEAFNLSPYTFKLRSKTTAADSLYIKGDTLYADQMAVSLAAVLKAVAVQTDTVRGSSSIVGVLDSAIRIDPDSSSAVVVITFGGYGGGLRWDRATDAMQYTNDFSTWTDIGTGGSSTTNADSLDGVLAQMRPLTDGYVVKYDADGDSLYLSQDATGAAGDSNAIIYSTDRVDMYSDSALYFGEVTDSAMLWYNLTDDNIISFVKVFYNEDVTDSALVTWGSMMAQIAVTGSGDITGVITSDWLTGGAASGDVSLGIDPDILAALYLTTDTTVLEGAAVKLRTSDYASSVTMVEDTIRVQNTGTGKIILNVDGTPTNTDEMTITENNIEIRSAGSNGVMVLSGYDVERVSFGAAGTMFIGNGISSTPSFFSTQTMMDTLYAIRAAINDSLQTNWATFVAGGGGVDVKVRDSLYKYLDTLNALSSSDELYAWLDTANAKIETAEVADSTNGGAVRAETAKVVIINSIDSTHIKDGGIGFADYGNNTIDSTKLRPSSVNASEITANVIDSTKIMPSSILKSELAIESVDSTKIIASSVLSPEIADGSIALADYGANSIDSTKIMPSSIKASELAVNVVDSTHLVANAIKGAEITANVIDSTKIMPSSILLSELAANNIDSTKIMPSSILASEIAANVIDSTKLTASSVLSSEILDGTISLADYGANSIDSTKIMPSSIKASELAVNVVDSTHLTANSVLASEIATGAVATAEILDGTVAKADLADELVRTVVPINSVHQPRYVRSGNDTLMLETAFTDTPFVWMVVGGAADVKGVTLMTATIPSGCTLLDSLYFGYESSSGTAATSAIDSIRVLVTSGNISPTWQLSNTTARSSATQASVGIDCSDDGDFNAGERIVLKIFTNVDANAWVGMINCYAVCR